MNAAIHRLRNRFAVTLICVLLGSTIIASAQSAPIPIIIGENQLGNLSDASASVLYSLSITTSMSVEIRVLAITPGFAPTFVVLDPGGGVVLDAANPGTQTIAYGMPSLSSPGAYTIAVSSANGVGGQYLISAQPGEIVATPTASQAPETGSVCTATIYGWYVLHEGPGTQYPTIEVGNETTAPTALVLGYFTLPPPDWNWFKVFINSKIGWLSEPTFELGENCDNIPLLVPPSSPTPTPTYTPVNPQVPVSQSTLVSTLLSRPNDACMVEAYLLWVYIYSGPSTSYGVVGSLIAGEGAPVIGRLENSWWYLINANGLEGWVSVQWGNPVISLPCNVPLVPPPPPPTSTPTNTQIPAAQVTLVSTLPGRPNEACVVQSASRASINVRSGPGAGYGIIGNLPPGISAPVIQKLADNSWFQANVDGVTGWVSASVVMLSGNCASIAIVQPPAPPPTQPQRSTVVAPTSPFKPTFTPAATPTNTPNPLLQITPIIRPGR